MFEENCRRKVIKKRLVINRVRRLNAEIEREFTALTLKLPFINAIK